MREIVRINDFKEILGDFHGGRILDVACGPGQFIEILVDSMASWEHITGLDLSDEIMAEARQKFDGKKFSFVTGSALELPFDDDTFDLVCISNGLHHVPDNKKTLNEMLRVVKEGGNVLVREMCSDGLNAAQESSKMYHHLRVEVDKLLGVDHFLTFTREELLEIINRLSLHDMKVFEYLEPVADPFDPGVRKEYIRKMEGWINELKNHPEKDNILQNLKRVEEKMARDGFARPPLLIFLGTKK